MSELKTSSDHADVRFRPKADIRPYCICGDMKLYAVVPAFNEEMLIESPIGQIKAALAAGCIPLGPAYLGYPLYSTYPQNAEWRLTIGIAGV